MLKKYMTFQDKNTKSNDHFLERTMGKWVRSTLIWVLVFSCAPSQAEEYFRWVDSQGVTHYGSTPPPGVEAHRVKTHGTRHVPEPTKQAQINTDSSSDAEALAEHKNKAEAAQKRQQKRCKKEKQRLSKLRSSGSRIRMKMEDGSIRYLSEGEILNEIANSETFIRELCGG